MNETLNNILKPKTSNEIFEHLKDTYLDKIVEYKFSYSRTNNNKYHLVIGINTNEADYKYYTIYTKPLFNNNKSESTGYIAHKFDKEFKLADVAEIIKHEKVRKRKVQKLYAKGARRNAIIKEIKKKIRILKEYERGYGLY